MVSKVLVKAIDRCGEVTRLGVWIVQLGVVNKLVIAANVVCHSQLIDKVIVLAGRLKIVWIRDHRMQLK